MKEAIERLRKLSYDLNVVHNERDEGQDFEEKIFRVAMEGIHDTLHLLKNTFLRTPS